MKRMMSWLMARSASTRVTNVMPRPESRYVIGRMAGSAPGAKIRTAMCAAVKAAKSPSGTARVWNVMSCPMVLMYMA